MISDKGLKEIKETVKTIKGLRDVLFEELDKLRGGEIADQKAKLIARFAQTIIDSARLEMDAYRHPLSDAFLSLPQPKPKKK